MKLQVVGTGSSGNTYLLHSETETLVIDAGVPFLEVKKAMDFNVSRIVGCIVTHCHLDHAKYASEYEAAGIDVLKAYEYEATGYVFRSFDVMPFYVEHNVPCVGYLIEHIPDGKRLLYVTDTAYVKYRFRNLTAMLIEANYADEYVDKSEAKYQHVLTGHMELQTTIDCIKANLNPAMTNVILCHLSDGNSNEEVFRQRVKEAVGAGVMVDVASNGMMIDLNEVPF